MRRDSDPDRSVLDWPRRTGTAEVVLRAVETHLSRRNRRRMTGAAGGLALFLAAGLLWQICRSPAPTVPPASILVTSPARQVLPDGSIVELKDDAKIGVDYAGALRRVRLERGAAHFQVKKNPSRGFVVAAGGVEVRAVGTVFCVQMDREAVGVLVTEGRVSVDQPAPVTDPAAAPRRIIALVDAGNRLVVKAAPRAGPARVSQVQPVSAAEIRNLLAWRSPRLEFSGTPLAEAVLMLNRFDRERLVLADPALGKLQLSGVLRADNVNAVLQLLKSNFGIVAEHRGDGEIVLLRAR
jgi:transmembrane sensor